MKRIFTQGIHSWPALVISHNDRDREDRSENLQERHLPLASRGIAYADLKNKAEDYRLSFHTRTLALEHQYHEAPSSALFVCLWLVALARKPPRAPRTLLIF